MSLDHAGQSIPKRCVGWAELMGAYRLLSNDAIDPYEIQSPHHDLTRVVCADHDVILAVSDITDLDFTGRTNISGLGKLGDGRGRGLQQHTVLAVDPCGDTIGILDQRWYKRPESPEGETRHQRQSRWCEPDVWADAARSVGTGPNGCRLIHVADRGADNFAMINTCFELKVDFLIRATHDRLVNDKSTHLWKHISGCPELGRMQVQVSAQRSGLPRDRRTARKATVALRIGSVQINPPPNDPRHADAPTRHVTAVYVREVNPPRGKDVHPVEWMLLTNEKATTLSDAHRLTEWYSHRWVIEEFHRVEKEGCGLEKTQLDHAQDIMRLAAVTGVVAVRLLQLRDMADTDHPDHNNPAALHTMVGPEWIEVIAMLTRTNPAKLTPHHFWKTIARQGGWIGRASDPRPGWKCIWRGWYDIRLIVQGTLLVKERMRCV